jgi:hypothetical protein
MDGFSWNFQGVYGWTTNGLVFADKVRVGSLEVKNQAVEAVKFMPAEFTKDISADGLLGLAFVRCV